MSILVHPDKNQDDLDRAQKAFEGNNFFIWTHLGWNKVAVIFADNIFKLIFSHEKLLCWLKR